MACKQTVWAARKLHSPWCVLPVPQNMHKCWKSCTQPLNSPVTAAGPLLLAAALEELAEEATLMDGAAQAEMHACSSACHGKSPPAVAGRTKRNTRASKRALAA